MGSLSWLKRLPRLYFLLSITRIFVTWFKTVACIGVRVSVTFHLTCVHIIFSSVSVAEWPPFGK